jgi:hypothetical protein
MSILGNFTHRGAKFCLQGALRDLRQHQDDDALGGLCHPDPASLIQRLAKVSYFDARLRRLTEQVTKYSTRNEASNDVSACALATMAKK